MQSMQVSHVYALLAARTHSAHREFNPSWIAVAKAWSKVPSSKRDSHFFATVEFEGNPALFQKVVFSFNSRWPPAQRGIRWDYTPHQLSSTSIQRQVPASQPNSTLLFPTT